MEAVVKKTSKTKSSKEVSEEIKKGYEKEKLLVWNIAEMQAVTKETSNITSSKEVS